MKFFAFVSERCGGVIGLTSRPDGENLPGSHRPWVRADGSAMHIRDAASPAFTRALERDGFYLMPSGLRSSRPPVRVEVKRRG